MTGAVLVVAKAQPAGASYSAAASPQFVNGVRSGGGTITTGSTTVTPTGGTGPYTYAWTKQSGDDFTVNSSTSATTTFTAYVPNASVKEAVYMCTVTDSAAATAVAYVGVYATSSNTTSQNGTPLL